MRHSKSFFLIALLITAISCADEEPTPKAELVVEDLNLTIDENPEVNQVLGVIAVENSEGSLAFTLTNQIPNGAMSINTTSGELVVADTALFNFEANPQITAQVNVTDMNSSGSAMITINLNDVDESFMFTIWSGPELNFTKADNADPNLVENQDEISASVAITRGNTGGQIYNAKLETSANKNTSPAGTKWAVGTVANIESLIFKPFREAVGDPKSVVGKDLILYLEAEDVYLPLSFSAWTQGNIDGGGFAYTRATED